MAHKYSRKQASAKLAVVAEQYAECTEWLSKCPFPSSKAGQAFYETAQPHLEDLGEQALEQARMLGDQALVESIEAAIVESEWGEYDEEWAFWRHISVWADGKVLK